jgi:hypothetical protein
MSTNTNHIAMLDAPNGELTKCPMCGQALVDHDAAERVAHTQEEVERELDAIIHNEAAKRAKELSSQEIEKERRAHQAELRTQRVLVEAEVAAEAEKTAKKKYSRELAKRERLIGQLSEQNEVQQRRIENLSSDERGEMKEEELLTLLRVEFPEDRIDRQGRGRAGSDILHEVRCEAGGRMEVAGLLIYECKDTQQWNNSFVEQAKKARRTHRTPHVLIVSRAFPRKEKGFCMRDGVPIVAAAHLVPLARLMRGAVIDLHRAALTNEGQAAKTQALYRYLSGNEFREEFSTLLGTFDRLIDRVGSERIAHEREWAERLRIYSEGSGRVGAIDGRIRAIIEGTDKKTAKVVALTTDAAA